MAPPTSAQGTGFAGLPVAAKLLLLVLLLGVTSALYYFGLHMSLAEDIDSAENKYAKLQDDMQKARERQQRFLMLSQELASREPLDQRNKRVLPPDAEIAGFLQDLNRLAEVSGLKMRLVQPRPEEAEPQFVRIPVSLSLSGRYHQLMKFFYNVGRLERAISMENLELLQPRLEGEEMMLDVNVRATTYRRAPTAAPEVASDDKSTRKSRKKPRRGGA